MRHAHSLRFDALETRQLLSRAHAIVPHTTPMAVASPLVLDGTLSVNNSPTVAMSTTNADGGSTTSLPVAGRLGTLGAVRGFWSETTDSMGDIEGLDTLRLRDSNGTFIIAFNNQTTGQPHHGPHGSVSYQQAQRFYQGTGAYANASERGTIDLTTNPAKTEVVSISLESKTS